MDNLKTYSTPKAVQAFEREKLFPAEQLLFNKYIKPNMKVLDLGCGTGRTTIHLQSFGTEVIGSDYATPMVERAKEKHPNINFQVIDVTSIPFPDQNFDAVVFSFNGLDYLHPVEQRYRALSEINRALKLGGVFIYSSHNALHFPWGFARMKDFLKNLFLGKIFTKYRWDFQQFGKLLTYFGTKACERKDLVRHGFALEEVITASRTYVYYMARKNRHITRATD